jgi:outer membrane lipoprotein-sorting protein
MRFPNLTVVLCFCGVSVFADTPAKPGPALNDVLAKMDAAAPGFTGMSANLKELKHTDVINDNSEQTGTILIRKQKGHDLKARIEIEKPDRKSVAFEGKKAEIYYPNINTVQEYNLGKDSDLIEQFLLLGFGTRGSDLKEAYSPKMDGAETVAGRPTYRLTLLPKTEARRKKLTKVDLWMDESGAYPIQQKLLFPSGDYYVFTYTDINLKPVLTDEALGLKIPKNAKKEYPQRDR